MLMTVEEAQSRILSRIPPPTPQELTPLISALGRVLAAPVYSEEDIPGFTNSSMDGYAVHSADVAHACGDTPATLTVRGTIAAGHPVSQPLSRGEAYKIMTGAPLPPAADAVIQVEWTAPGEPGQVLALWAVRPGQNVRLAGQDMQKGQRVLEPGLVVSPPIVGILATLGIEQVPVFPRPRVAIVSTGDELVSAGEPLRPGQIRNSNSYALAAAVQAAGAEPWVFPPVADVKTAIAERFAEAASADIVLSSGGVSVGDFDWVKEVLQEQGTLDLWRVNMKPGKPVAFGSIHGRPFFGLPGNPVSALVTFELFVRPMIREMMQDRLWARPTLSLPLHEDFSEVQDRRHYVRSRLVQDQGRLWVRPYSRQDSAVQTSWIGAEALMVVPPDTGPYARGEHLPVMLLRSGF